MIPDRYCSIAVAILIRVARAIERLVVTCPLTSKESCAEPQLWECEPSFFGAASRSPSDTRSILLNYGVPVSFFLNPEQDGWSMNRTWLASPVLAVAFCSMGRGDVIDFRYEGDAIPYQATPPWMVDNPCDPPCSESIENGRFVLGWPFAGNQATYTIFLTEFNAPPPPTFWIEWRFRSNHPLGGNFYTCDGGFIAQYHGDVAPLNMYGDAAISFSGDDVVRGLDIDSFHTYRFEIVDDLNYFLAVDGVYLETGQISPGCCYTSLSMIGAGGCISDQVPNMVNEWDYVRTGGVGFGEQIIAADPPAGFLDPSVYSPLNRFRITFDAPNFVYLDEITSQVISPPTPNAPQVKWVQRCDTCDEQTLDIVLDRPLTVGQTTRFTFNDGGAANTVEYTLGAPGACCMTDGSCSLLVDPLCTDGGHTFVPDASCSLPQPCCFSDSTCQMLASVCCTAAGGSVGSPNAACDNDTDQDGIDRGCGDDCPGDAAKLQPGLCGCGQSDTADSDADTILDCFDQCPGVDDGVFAPGCTVAIPAASEWGLVVITLCLLCAGKVGFGLLRSNDG